MPYAVGALIAFVIALVLDVIDAGGEWVGFLTLGGLALVAAHLAFGSRRLM